MTLAWWATEKVLVSYSVPARALTLTRSPALNGLLGKKLSPVPVE